ncbi:MAG: RnfH family protein [Betaproteobacteria bacterium]|nr:RnfH family protein [Betaproteobacteria bacterium]
MSEQIRIEVAYALPEAQTVIQVTVPPGTSVRAAVEASGLLQKHPDIDLETNKLGIYGKLVKPDTVLRDRDRVEIYRPLKADPKEVRRKRAEEGKPMKKGGGD